MESETKICQNCKKDFIVEAEDFNFYKKINVPSPTFCPECRFIRRLFWRNERNLYKRKCFTKDGEKELISNYNPDVSFPVYEEKYWWGDDWDARDYAQDYDFSMSFFEQFKELLDKVPQPHATNLQSVNSNFCNFTYQSKNCYLAFASDINEDCAYLHQTYKSKNSFDLENCNNMESCIDSFKSRESYNSSHLFFSQKCIDSHLMWDCQNCSSCFGCVGLRGKSYCIFNKQYTKEDYEIKIKEYLDGSYNTLQRNLKDFFVSVLSFPRKYADIVGSVNVTGDYLKNAKDCHYCFDVADKVENCKYMTYAFQNVTDCFDFFAGGVNMELSYESMCVGDNANSVFMSGLIWTSSNIFYSYFCGQSNDLFGCIGLRHKQYCILNKQYSREEYFEMVEKIKKQMNEIPYEDKRGNLYKYGEFFPDEISPFAYNETPIKDYFSLTKEEIIGKKLKWREKEKNHYDITLKSIDIPDNIKDVPESILNEVIECGDSLNENSTSAFRIIKPELDLYRKMNLPLPRKSPNVRYYERLKYRNPYKLWHRACQCGGKKSENGVYQNTVNHFHEDSHCQNEFETSYSPDRPEIIYCEKCYQQEVY